MTVTFLVFYKSRPTNLLHEYTVNIAIQTTDLSEVATQKEDQTMVFKTNYRLMQVKIIAECSAPE